MTGRSVGEQAIFTPEASPRRGEGDLGGGFKQVSKSSQFPRRAVCTVRRRQPDHIFNSSRYKIKKAASKLESNEMTYLSVENLDSYVEDKLLAGVLCR